MRFAACSRTSLQLRTVCGGGSATVPVAPGVAAVLPLDAEGRVVDGGAAVDAAGVVLGGDVPEQPASTLRPASPVQSAKRARRSMQCTIDFLCQFF
jgi:hypothetical protein